jgi:NAD(P)-dependent dehydrogenase (short-subunit alcohol dehydrogenase family)
LQQIHLCYFPVYQEAAKHGSVKRRRQGSGYIVNVGSIGGLIAIPYQPLYSASKFALEGMTESLRMEVRRFGIRVIIIEPGDTKTVITQNRRMAAATVDQHAYRSLAAALKRTGPGPEGIAWLLWRIVNTPNPRLRYTVGLATQRAAVCGHGSRDAALLRIGVREGVVALSYWLCVVKISSPLKSIISGERFTSIESRLIAYRLFR